MRKLITPEIEQQIVVACRAEPNATVVAKRFELSNSIVSKIMRKNSITTTNTKIDANIEQCIVDECRAGAAGAAVARKYSISKSSVVNILRRHNVETKTGRRPSCEIDHSVFDTITPESAYWIGFLFADGGIADYGGTPAVRVGLSAKDRDHVEKFRTFLKSTHKIHDVVVKTNLPNETDSKHRQAVHFVVRSQKLVDALRARGFDRKGIERAPTAELENSIDFWRGCVDGDGTVRVHVDDRRDYHYPCIILCGHMPLLEKYQSFLMRQGVAANIIDTTSGIFQIRMLGVGALAIIRLLYANATVALDRKHKTASEILANQSWGASDKKRRTT